eukprot:1153959-Pelagomonas_calceolata.AAC.3
MTSQRMPRAAAHSYCSVRLRGASSTGGRLLKTLSFTCAICMANICMHSPTWGLSEARALQKSPQPSTWTQPAGQQGDVLVNA